MREALVSENETSVGSYVKIGIASDSEGLTLNDVGIPSVKT